MGDENVEEVNELTEEEQQSILWTGLAISFGIDVFATRLESQISQLRNAGIGDRAIIDSLRGDFDSNGRIFGEYRNSVKRGIVSGIMRASRSGQDRVFGDSVKYRWVSVGSKKICSDCESRIGQVESWEVWETLGLPATGFSRCREFCYCQLMPEHIEIDDRIIFD